MKNIFYSLLINICLFTTPGFTQVRPHIGAVTAVNASFVLDEGLSKDPRYDSKMTYKFAPIGLSLGVDFTPAFGLNLESIYAQQGQIYEIIGKVDNIAQAVGERKISTEYLQLPILLNFMGGGNARTRANFMLGPQFSFLTKAVETYQQTQRASFTLPEKADLPDYADANSYNSINRNYTVSNTEQITLANTELNNAYEQFKKSQFGIAAAFGLNIDLTNFIYLTSQIRANYNLTDMRNEDFAKYVQSGQTGEVFSKRADLLVGVQLGVHVMFGGTRKNTRMLVK